MCDLALFAFLAALLAAILVPTTVCRKRLVRLLSTTFSKSSLPSASASTSATSAAVASSNARSVPWHEYLPTGNAFKFLCDVRKCGTALAALCDTYGDTLHVWLGPTPTVVCGHPGDVAHILASASQFERPDGMRYVLNTTVPNSLLSMPRHAHRVARAKLRHTFNHTMLPDFHPRMVAAIAEVSALLLDTHAEAAPDGQFSEPLDISEVLSMLTFRVVTNVALGSTLGIEEGRRFARDVDNFLNGVFIEAIAYPYRPYLAPLACRRHLVHNRRRVARVCEEIIAQRLRERRQGARVDEVPYDVLDAILDMDDEEGPGGSGETAVSHVMVFMMAGAHTVAHSMSWLLFEALQQPDVMQRLTREVDDVCGARRGSADAALRHEDVISRLPFLRAVWRETLRVRPPAAMHVRKAATDVVLRGSGVVVRKGMQVAALLERAHKHDSVYRDARAFQCARWGLAPHDCREGDRAPVGAFVPFGVGESSCIGQFFGEYEALLVLGELFRRFEFSLACRPQDVMSSASWVNVARYDSAGDGRFDKGIPIRVRRRR